MPPTAVGTVINVPHICAPSNIGGISGGSGIPADALLADDLTPLLDDSSAILLQD